MIDVNTAVPDTSTLAICPPLAKFSGMHPTGAPGVPSQRGEFRGRLGELPLVRNCLDQDVARRWQRSVNQAIPAVTNVAQRLRSEPLSVVRPAGSVRHPGRDWAQGSSALRTRLAGFRRDPGKM